MGEQSGMCRVHTCKGQSKQGSRGHAAKAGLGLGHGSEAHRRSEETTGLRMAGEPNTEITSCGALWEGKPGEPEQQGQDSRAVNQTTVCGVPAQAAP